MKKTHLLLLLTVAVSTVISCNDLDFKRTDSGVLYKLYPSKGSKDSLIKPGQIVKFNVINKLNDSVLFTSYGKMPEFFKVPAAGKARYSPVDIFTHLRKGDSVVVVTMADSMLNKGAAGQLPPGTKMGDRFTTIFKVLEVFNNDSLARTDYDAESKRDEPRRLREQAEEKAKVEKQLREKFQQELEDARQSGEVDKELKSMEEYLAARKINAQKTGMGVFVEIQKQGDGPVVDSGKVVTVKYTGRKLETDSVFESNSYKFVLGQMQVIPGWDQGLKVFKKGGKGVLFIPGFLAYGKKVQPGSIFKPNEPLIFDVEIMDVKDNTESAAN